MANNTITISIKTFFKREVVQHIAFWVIYFVLNTIRWGSYFEDYSYSFYSNLVEFPIHILLVYFNLYYLLPRMIPGKVGLYISSLFLSILFMTLMRIIITYQLVTEDVWRETYKQVGQFNIHYILEVFIGEMYVVGITTAIKLTIDRVKYLRKTRELQKRNYETELAFLRSQIQPHFFFNTLNNLYALTLEKSDQAPETVVKLSELMKYVIYGSKRKFIPLCEEVNQIQNYLDLEKLRFGKRLNIDLEIEGSMDDKYVAPMVLLPFIENSFKHGVTGKIGEIPIRISLRINNKHLHFFVQNEKNTEIDYDSSKPLVNNYGIGIQNTRRRLELLYDNDYDLSVSESDHTYSLTLIVPVHDNKMHDIRR